MGGGTYEQHDVVNVKNVFQEIHGTATVVPGSKSGGGAGQSLGALGHFQSIVGCVRHRSSLSPRCRCCGKREG